jgi:molybdopterin biosynthesis enzyme
MMGRAGGARPEIGAVLEEDVGGPPDRTRYARVYVTRSPGGEGFRARPTGSTASHLLATVSRANGLAIIPAGVEVARAGDEVTVSLFRDRRLLDDEG